MASPFLSFTIRFEWPGLVASSVLAVVQLVVDFEHESSNILLDADCKRPDPTEFPDVTLSSAMEVPLPLRTFGNDSRPEAENHAFLRSISSIA